MEHVLTEPLLCVGAVSGSASQLYRRHYCDPYTLRAHSFLPRASCCMWLLFFCQKAFLWLLWGMRPVKVLSINEEWEWWVNNSPPHLSCLISGTCSEQFPGMPSDTEPWLPTPVTSLILCYLPDTALSHSTSLPMVCDHPQISHVNLNPACRHLLLEKPKQ